MRIGQGFDVHPFVDDAARPLVLGGVSILGGAYFTSRGLAKAGSPEPHDEDPEHGSEGAAEQQLRGLRVHCTHRQEPDQPIRARFHPGAVSLPARCSQRPCFAPRFHGRHGSVLGAPRPQPLPACPT